MFYGKVGLVTGAGSGMGRAAALAMAREGATIILIGRSEDKLSRVHEEISEAGGRSATYAVDVADREAQKELMRKIEIDFGRLDFAFNNAGGHADFKPIGKTSDEELDWVTALNFKAVMYGIRDQVELMAKNGGGSIVNNASVFGLKAVAGIAHYVASKFAVIGLTKAVALEYAAQGIRVNAVAPGATETPNYILSMNGDLHGFDSQIPMHRIGQPDEVAEAVVWLMSGSARYVTGAVLSVDGGMAAG